ncbi:MAG: anti-sigma F factor [Clostridia bacterium]|nr:anti-sigma F factor [Clostridia bacterium]
MKTSKKVINSLKLSFPSLSVNESAARAVVAAFSAQADPTTTELADIKCAVSEAVTNCIVHGYPDSIGEIYISVKILEGRTVRIEIKDKGKGIEDIALARTPLYTTSPETERSGMGFTVMESFMDKITVRSRVGKGTTVVLFKTLKERKKAE